MGIRSRTSTKYIFSPPYHRDTRLVAKPLYSTTHETTYPYHETGRYDHVTSRYKQQSPFVISSTKNVYRGISRSLRPYIPYVGRKR